MHAVIQLDLDDAREILASSRQEAHRRGAPVSIAVVDGGGHPLLLERLSGASPASAEAALAKARMAALTRRATSQMEASINLERPALLQLAGVLGGSAVAMGGGLPLLIKGHCLGAVGVSGLTPADDNAIAEAGAEALPPVP